MFDPRIYRAALLPAIAALAVVMFSFQPIPNPLPPPVATPTFDGSEAARTARSIVSLAPDRTPGSDGDRAVADLVEERFTGIEGGQVSTQTFDSSFDGEDVTLENVILTLPGISDRTILVVAARDAPEGTGATTSASATSTLLGLADDLGRSRRNKTMIFASTDGGGDGTEGVEELIDALPQPENVEAAFVIAQPGVPEPKAPFVIGAGSGPDSPSAQLVQTARDIATAKFAERDPAPGPWVGLSRLAFPGGLGEQVALRRAGIEALGISAHGERPVPAADAGPEAISSETLDASGATMLELLLTLDHTDEPIDEGPDEYIRIGDNLVPGWTLSLLAVALLLAPLLTAGDTWLREHRNDWRVRKTLFWAGERVLIPFAALLLVPIALAAVTLDIRSTVGVTALALICIAVLALWAGPLPWRGGGLSLPALYRVGGWAGLSLAIMLIAVFAWSVAEEARQRSEALTATQLALAREQQLSALGGQAAAVAHLLGTPLATINVIAKELVRELPHGSPLVDEAGELLAQAQRCRELLAGLGKQPDDSGHQTFTRAPFTSLLEHIAGEYGRAGVDVRIQVAHTDATSEPEVALTPELRHSLANLIDNAIQFATSRVLVTLRPTRVGLTLVIEDDGPGFPHEVLDWLGEPFLSTRREEGGLGLGIFIATTLLARTGAKINFDNTDRGARVTIRWPADRMTTAFGTQR